MNKTEKFNWLVWRLHMATEAMEAGTDPKFASEPNLPRTINQCVSVIRYLVNRVTDSSLCCNNCKSMYYCELKKNHEGQHKEEGLCWD